MTETEAERFLAALREMRLAGDVSAAGDVFTDDAIFHVVGVEAEASGKEAIRAALASLFEQFEFLEWEPIAVVVSGDDIAARHRLKVRHRPTGNVMETETCEFMSLQDGRCRSFTQYTDTAKVAQFTAS